MANGALVKALDIINISNEDELESDEIVNKLHTHVSTFISEAYFIESMNTFQSSQSYHSLTVSGFVQIPPCIHLWILQ